MKYNDIMKSIAIPVEISVVTAIVELVKKSMIMGTLMSVELFIAILLLFILIVNFYDTVCDFVDEVLELLNNHKINKYNQHIPHEYSNVFTQKAEK
jgi:hypothetical protein